MSLLTKVEAPLLNCSICNIYMTIFTYVKILFIQCEANIIIIVLCNDSPPTVRCVIIDQRPGLRKHSPGVKTRLGVERSLCVGIQ